MKKVDITAIKFNQASIVVLTLLAYLLDLPWLVLLLAVVLGLGAIWPEGAFFQQVYRQVFRPLGLLRSVVINDDPAPHRFAQGMGAAVLSLSSLALLAFNVAALGWALAGLVAVLAAVNLFFDFCAGCFVYYQLARLGLIRRSQTSS